MKGKSPWYCFWDCAEKTISHEKDNLDFCMWAASVFMR
jgi:hypothetical protein